MVVKLRTLFLSFATAYNAGPANLPVVAGGTRTAFWLGACIADLALTAAALMPHPRMIMFGAGILVREVLDMGIPWERFGNFAALVAFLFALALIGFRDVPVVTYICGPVVLRSTIALCLLFSSTLMLTYYTLRDDGLLGKLFSWDWLRCFGNMSYSYYLAHCLFLHIIKAAAIFFHVPKEISPLPFLVLLIVSIVCTIAGSAVIFLAVEKPSFSRRGRSLKPASPQPDALWG